jgi:hypothetical protein
MVVRRERGEGIDGMQGGLLNEARENESGVRTTAERKKHGTKERRHRPRRRDLGKTGGRLPDGGSEGEAGKESWTGHNFGDFSSIGCSNFLPRVPSYASVPLGEMKGKAKVSAVHSDPR